MALYSVVIDIPLHVVIEAEDDDHAWEIAHDDINEVLQDVDLRRLAQICVLKEVKSTKDLPPDWDDRCIPYGGDGNTRIADLMSRVEGDGE